MKFFRGFDHSIIIPSLLLLSISLIVLSSLDINLFYTQLVFILLGLIVFFVTSSININAFRSLGIVLYIVSFFLLLSLLFLGTEVRGARRWVQVFGFSMQFSEVIKPLLLISIAAFLAKWQGKITFPRLVVSIVFFLPIAFLLLQQPDLGNAIVYVVTFGFMLFAGGASIWYFITGAICFVLSFPLIWRGLAEYQRNRILTFLHPSHDPLGIGYNAIQSSIAVGSGLLLGRGLGKGVQSQLAFLPERHTDFIFATFSEEFGFLGSLLVLVLYFLLLYRIISISHNASTSFERYITLGIFMLFIAHVFINIGMNLGIVPITGITLPLFSYGGSSLLASMSILGIAQAISRHSREREHVLEIR